MSSQKLTQRTALVTLPPKGRIGNAFTILKAAVAAVFLFLPLAALAQDTRLFGFCGNSNPPSSYFEFTSSTLAEIKAQLISAQTARAVAVSQVAIEKDIADTARTMGCVRHVAPLPTIVYCLSSDDCTAQVNGETWFSCTGWPDSSHAINTYAVERGGCRLLGEVLETPIPPPKKAVVIIGVGEVHPAGTGGTSEITLTAKVTSDGTPNPGVALGFSVDVTPNSGGHEHHDVARPKGTLGGTQGTTDANGEVKVTFKAPEVAGIHTIKATCATCSNSPATKEIQVKVPDLLPIFPNAPQNADGTFVYALTSVDKTHQGNGRYHHNQYDLTEQSRQNLLDMVGAFAAEGWGTVAVNDASLYWGGRYDISSNWTAPHAGHRDGREIDVSFARAGNPISASKQKVFYKKFCETKTVQASFSILHHFVKNPHFHVYLEKQTACWKSEK